MFLPALKRGGCPGLGLVRDAEEHPFTSDLEKCRLFTEFGRFKCAFSTFSPALNSSSCLGVGPVRDAEESRLCMLLPT